MAKIYMMCGRICSGKSTYAERLRKEQRAVVLSVDEITLALFDGNTGSKHGEYVERAEKYLYAKSLEILECNINVVLDWGFWTRAERDFAREFYGSRGIEFEFICIGISDEEWQRRIAKRNAKEVQRNKISVQLEPMTPDERRIVHNTLTGWEHIKTESSGEGRERAVTIKYVD